MKKIIVMILAVVLVGVGALYIIGQTSEKSDQGAKRFGKRGHQGNFGKRGKRMGRGEMMGRGFRMLNLTDAQKEQMKAIRKSAQEGNKTLRAEAKANQTALHKLNADGAFDESKVAALAKRQGEFHAQMIIGRHKVQSQMFAVLTAEQKTKLAEMKESFKKKMDERKAKRGKSRDGETSQ